MKKERITTKLMASLICVLIGLALGFAALLIIEPKGAFAAWVTMLQNFLYYPNPGVAWYYVGTTLVRTIPLAMCALSIIYAKNAGLFNIGASGQYTAGALVSLLLAIKYHMPWWVCLLGAMLAAGLAGVIVGYLRAYRGANEVITGILVNWILLYLANNMLEPFTDSAKYTLKLAANEPQALLPNLGLDWFFNNNRYVTIAIPLAVIVILIVRYIIAHTVLGYETRATGFNMHAARLSGMRAERNMLLTMFIAGALCGMAASFSFLSGMEQWTTTASNVPSIGFDAIAAAYLGGLHPIGTLLSSFFIQHISMGSINMDKLVYPSEVANIVIAIIIYTSAFASLIAYFVAEKKKNSGEKENNLPEKSADSGAKKNDPPETADGKGEKQ